MCSTYMWTTWQKGKGHNCVGDMCGFTVERGCLANHVKYIEKMYFYVASLILCLQSTIVSIGGHMTPKTTPRKGTFLPSASFHRWGTQTGVNHRGENLFQVSQSGKRLAKKYCDVLTLNTDPQRHPRPSESLSKRGCLKRNFLKQ